MIVEELVTIFRADAKGTGELQRFNKQIDKGRQGLRAFHAVLAGFAGGIAVGAFAGLTRAVTNFARSIPNAVRDLDRLAKTADKVGVSVENLQRLRHAADLSGVATGTLDMAMQRFSRRIGEAVQGSGELRDTLKQYGIAVKDSNGRTRSNVEILGDLADVIARVDNAQERGRISQKAFDSEGVAMVNMLKNGAAGLREMMAEADAFKLVFGEDSVRAAEKFNNNLTRLNALTKALKTAIAIDLLPLMDEWVKASIAWYKVNREIIRQRMSWVISGMGRVVRQTGGHAAFAAEKVRDLSEAIKGLTGIGGGGQALAAGGLLALLGLKKGGALGLAGRLSWWVILAAAIDDVVTGLRGGNSVLGEFLKKLPGNRLSLAEIYDPEAALKEWEELFAQPLLKRMESILSLIFTGDQTALHRLDEWLRSHLLVALDNVVTKLQDLWDWVAKITGIKSGDGASGSQRPAGRTGRSFDRRGSSGSEPFPPEERSGRSGPIYPPGSRGGKGASLNQGSLPAGQQARANRMMNRLIAKGWMPEAAASVVGQAAHESSFNPTALGDNGTAYGLFQWRLDRRQALKDFADARGKPVSDFDTQVDFFDQERKQRSQAERNWHTVTDVDQGNRIGKQFERYAGGLQHGRATSGRKALAEWRRRGGMAQIGQPSASPAFEMFGRGAGGLAAVSNTISQGDRIGGNVNLSVANHFNHTKGDVAPKKVEAAIASAMARVRAAQRSTDIANQYPVPDGPVIRETQ